MFVLGIGKGICCTLLLCVLSVVDVFLQAKLHGSAAVCGLLSARRGWREGPAVLSRSVFARGFGMIDGGTRLLSFRGSRIAALRVVLRTK